MQRERVNHRIRVPQVVVIDEQGQQLGVMETDAARELARERGLDLVEVSPNVSPPVCKLMDYGRYLYDKKKRAQSAKSKSTHTQLKEVKYRPNTDTHDLETKTRKAAAFLGEGHKCKITVMFRGREMAHPERGRELLDRVVEMLDEVAEVELAPHMEGRFMSAILAPRKGKKKGAS
ncbi:MAG: translation initiation factor IF-3 [Nitrospirae bacterium]|nr:MAG: translation initiation factor IF-3 [Nitrospirota bacterium]